MKKIFCAFWVFIMLFAVVGCNGAKTNGKTVIGSFENSECFVTVDVFSLKAGAYDAFFVRTDENRSFAYDTHDTHATQEKFPCRVIVIDEENKMRETLKVVENPDGTLTVTVKIADQYFGKYMTREEMEDYTVKKYLVEVYLPKSDGTYYQKLYVYDHETQTWK